MWINLDELLDFPKVTVVNYEEIEGVLFLKLRMKNEEIECPNCHQKIEEINQTEYNLVRDLSISTYAKLITYSVPKLSRTFLK